MVTLSLPGLRIVRIICLMMNDTKKTARETLIHLTVDNGEFRPVCRPRTLDNDRLAANAAAVTCPACLATLANSEVR